MRVLVLGSTGMLGTALAYQLRREGFDVACLSKPQFDACEPDFSLVTACKPDAVVNAIGMINRRLDRPEAEFLRTNSLFPRRMADWCALRSLPFIHVSTDCVFRGDAAPYFEDATPDATDRYGQTKAWGEPANAMVLRTSIVGPELHNHYSLLCWFLRQNGQARGFRNHRWNGLTTLELGHVIGIILRRGLFQHGVRHVHGEDLTKLELLLAMKAAFGKDIDIEPADDVHARDTRLRSRHPDFLAALGIASMQDQLDRLRAISDDQGNWLG